MSNNEFLSRRALLGGAVVSGSALALEACGGDDGPTTPNPDIEPLNNLLSAEYRAIKAYDAGIPILMTPMTGDPQAASGPIVAAVATNWQAQHEEHAAQLAAAITAIGGTPVARASVMFAPPSGFTATVTNVMILACNAEKAAAVAYNQGVKNMSATSSRYLATNIEGAETQHFVILYSLLKQLASPGGAIVTMVGEIASKAFVANVGTMTNGLNALADFTYT